MRQCAKCSTHTEDHVQICPNCEADFKTDSVRAHSLVKIIASPRVSMLRVVAWHDCCPACRAVEGAHPLDNFPALPVAGCSGADGCRCQYEPVVIEVGP